jgi:hypothetical protein
LLKSIDFASSSPRYVGGDFSNTGTFTNHDTLHLTGTNKTLSTVSSNPALGHVTVSGNIDFTSNASTTNLTVSSGGDFTPYNLLTIGGNFTQSGTINFSGKTIYITGTSPTFSGTMTGSNMLGNVVLDSTATIATFDTGDLTVKTGKALTKTTLGVAGNLLIQGTVNDTGTVTLSGTNKTVTTSDPDFSDTLTITGSTTLLSNASTTDLTINASAVLDPYTALTVGGNFANSGSFTAGNSIIYLAGTGALSGSLTGSNKFDTVNFKETAGATWTSRAAAGSDDDWMDVVYGNGRFVAVGDYGDHRVMYSDDNGVTWTGVSSGNALDSNDEWQAVTYGESTFGAVGCDGKWCNNELCTLPMTGLLGPQSQQRAMMMRGLTSCMVRVRL